MTRRALAVLALSAALLLPGCYEKGGRRPPVQEIREDRSEAG